MSLAPPVHDEDLLAAVGDVGPDEAHTVFTAALTVSAELITPPAGCLWVEIDPSADIYVRTDNTAAVVPISTGTQGSTRFPGGVKTPVLARAGVKIYGISASGSAVAVNVVPMKAR